MSCMRETARQLRFYLVHPWCQPISSFRTAKFTGTYMHVGSNCSYESQQTLSSVHVFSFAKSGMLKTQSTEQYLILSFWARQCCISSSAILLETVVESFITRLAPFLWLFTLSLKCCAWTLFSEQIETFEFAKITIMPDKHSWWCFLWMQQLSMILFPEPWNRICCYFFLLFTCEKSTRQVFNSSYATFSLPSGIEWYAYGINSFGNSSAGPWFSKKSKGLVHLGIIVQFRYLGLGSSGSELPVIF